MDLGLHRTLDDSNSKLDPEVIALADSLSPQFSDAFGQVWDLFQTKAEPFETDEFEVLQRQYTNKSVEIQPSGAGSDWDTDSDTSALPVNSSHVDRITVGDMLLVEDEIVVVSAVDRNSNDIDVYERGAGETSAAAHGTSNITVDIIGNAHIEGNVDAEAMAEGTDVFTNYTQLVEEVVDLSYQDTQQARKVGETEEVLKQEAMRRVMQDLARTAVHGTARVPSSSVPSLTRGLLGWMALSSALSTNVGGAFTETSLDNAFENIRKNGGNANAIVLSVNNKQVANDFTGADQINQDVGDREAGRIIDAYLADGFGRVPFVVDLDMPDDRVVIVDSNRMEKGWKVGDQLRFEEETNTSSREDKETLQGRFGLAMQNIGQTHHLLDGLTT